MSVLTWNAPQNQKKLPKHFAESCAAFEEEMKSVFPAAPTKGLTEKQLEIYASLEVTIESLVCL